VQRATLTVQHPLFWGCSTPLLGDLANRLRELSTQLFASILRFVANFQRWLIETDADRKLLV
jgi:hypothetical protein